jgi:nitric oxide reductase subunit C
MAAAAGAADVQLGGARPPGMEARMNERIARWFCWVGTLLSLGILAILTVDTHRQVNARAYSETPDSHVVDGKRAWHRHNCNDCHTILGFGSYYGPDLTKVYWRRGEEGIRRAVRTPEQVTTWRSMPHLGVTDQELADLVAFLRWTGEIDTHGWPPQDRRQPVAAAGAAAGDPMTVFRENGCYDCHRMGSVGGELGPDLTKVGSRLPYETIDALLVEPRSVNARAVMPAPGLPDPERQSLARFLAGSK